MSAFIPPSPSADDYKDEDQQTDLSWCEATDPVALFKTWLASAGETEPNDPNAMSLATVDETGLPDVRIVLLKGVSEDGFVFYTNSESAKGRQLTEQPKAALCFHWKSVRRQVRVRGTVSPVSADTSDDYFSSRARGSRLSAWASDQSRPVADREALLTSLRRAEAQFDGQDVPRPPHWYGYQITPNRIEFWQNGAFRLHDRVSFTRSDPSGVWTKVRLYP